MKFPSLTLFFLTCFFCQASAQIPSSCIPSSLLASAYGNDIKDLALNRMYAVHSPDTTLINIPVIYQDSVLAGLAAIYNTGTLLQADSVFNAYCIHDYPYGFIQASLSVKVDTSYAWTLGWKHLSTTTGNGPLDSFMNRYGFTIEGYDSTSFLSSLRNRATINTNMVINTRAFADSLAMFPGVLFIEFNGYAGDHSTIIYNRDSVGTYQFCLGWGDCPAGCTSRKIWKYKVDDLCNVTLLSVILSAIDPFPVPPNCNLYPLATIALNEEVNVKVYPNPAGDVLHIDFIGSGSDYSFRMADMFGRVVRQGTTAKNTTISMTDIPSGIYVLNVRDSEGRMHHEKIVKE